MDEIKIFPNKILRKVVTEIKSIDGDLKERIGRLKKYLTNCSNAAGLAAPQMGWNDNFFGIKGEKGKVDIYINPKIVQTWGEKQFLKLISTDNNQEEDFLEGCLSFPNIFGTVKRYYKIEVEWLDGKKIMEGFEAIVFQHELDHLNGILLIDRIKESQGRVYRIKGEKKEEIELQSLEER